MQLRARGLRLGGFNEITADLRRLLGGDRVLDASRDLLTDSSVQRGVKGTAVAVVRPQSPEEVRKSLSWCYAREIPITPRGGGTGLAGGAVPLARGIVLDLTALNRVRSFEPGWWRIELEAGVRTGTLHRHARENGVFFPPDPGASEQSTVGGNIATNAGGPRSFRYGVTGQWVTGLEVVVPPGEVLTLGGKSRKDVAGFDLRGLMIGSEGTLAVITAATLRLIPAPESQLPVVATFPDLDAGISAIEAVMGAGIEAAAIEYLDGATLRIARDSFPGEIDSRAGFLILAECDGSQTEAVARREELIDVLSEDGTVTCAPDDRVLTRKLWRWRDGVPLAVASELGGKVSEDIVVPVDRLGAAAEEVLAIGARHGLRACSWGHAGDGNLHATFLVELNDMEQLERARCAEAELFGLAERLGGSISGEHGIGLLKRDFLGSGWSERQHDLMRSLKAIFDPLNLLNPGKVVAPPPAPPSRSTPS